MSFIVVIPARLASTRLPNKPLLDIGGKPMIQHVWEQARKSDASAVYIATDHQSICDVATAFGAKVCMTSASHESGTDRLQEVVNKLGLPSEQVLVNVQGDEPLIPPQVINQVAGLMGEGVAMATLFEHIKQVDQVFDPNIVKLVTDEYNNALYFSRAPIPWFRDGFSAENPVLPKAVEYKRHIGIYAYRARLLDDFVTWPMSALEAVEKLEQLRVLSNGVRIQVAEACETIPPGVDTQRDLDVVRAFLAK
jgi:3-deoxy-manno-octulosonate cytidylyltransferase (CMP-KDO synthetase)